MSVQNVKEEARRLVENLPEDVTWDDLMYRIYAMALGFANVQVHHADGTLGWPPGAPYEAICVAAGAPAPPQALLDQLAIGGRLVLPHGPADHQQLVRITRRDATTFHEEDLGDVRFVPLVGAQGWPETMQRRRWPF